MKRFEALSPASGADGVRVGEMEAHDASASPPLLTGTVTGAAARQCQWHTGHWQTAAVTMPVTGGTQIQVVDSV
jgi:hypothetical protein